MKARAGAILLSCALLLIAGCVNRPDEYREPAPLSRAERVALNQRVYQVAWQKVRDNFFDAGFSGKDWTQLGEKYRQEATDAESTDKLYQAINRLLAELNVSHLQALPPRRAHEARTGSRVSAGFSVQQSENDYVVTDIFAGGPADLAGIKKGWLVKRRNGVPLRDALRNATAAKVGESVSFEFVDQQDQTHTVPLQLALIEMAGLTEQRSLEDGLLYLRFDRFDRETLSWLSQQLKSHRQSRGLILDLRQNPGGNILMLEMALGEFFTENLSAGTIVTRAGKEKSFGTLGLFSAQYQGKIVILTSRASASAAEIFTHVMQAYDRATVVGSKTSGQVLAAHNYDLPNQGSLQVAYQEYRGIDDQRLEGSGVKPDHEVGPATLAQLRGLQDPALDKAIALLK